MFLIPCSSLDPVCFGQTTCILSTKICHLGELALVLELGCQPFECHWWQCCFGIGQFNTSRSLSGHWDTSAKRARMRAIFAKGNPGPYVLSGEQPKDLPIYISLSSSSSSVPSFISSISTVLSSMQWFGGSGIWQYYMHMQDFRCYFSSYSSR